MELQETATLVHREGEVAGWYLNERLIPDSAGRTAEAVLDELTQAGWRIAMIGATCSLTRPAFRTAGMR